MSMVSAVSAIILTGFSSVCSSGSPSSTKIESHKVSRFKVPWKPEFGTEAKLYHVMLSPELNYLLKWHPAILLKERARLLAHETGRR